MDESNGLWHRFPLQTRAESGCVSRDLHHILERATQRGTTSKLDLAARSVEHKDRRPMKRSTEFLVGACLAICLLAAHGSSAQQQPAQSTPLSNQKQQSPTELTEAQSHTRLTVEVTGGDSNTPVENASVYVKFVEEHAIKKNKKLEINVKTSREGVAHVPDVPMGRALVQVVAEGWKTYGRWMDITDPKQIIKIHLDRPPKWY